MGGCRSDPGSVLRMVRLAAGKNCAKTACQKIFRKTGAEIELIR